jgi:chlorite dismutase
MERNGNGDESGSNGGGLRLQAGRRQFVKFTFFKIDCEWRRLPADERDRQIAELVGVLGDWAERTLVRCYSTLGTRGDCDMMVWHVSYELDDIQALLGDVFGTAMGGYLMTPHSYLSMTKNSAYVEKYAGPGEDRFTRLALAPGNAKYLFVYPMTKLREWYGLPKDERQEAMNQHIAIGATYSTVKINTTYSFGLDDPEFVVAFESDSPADFLDLVQELRGSVSSAYTQTDVPVFTCRAVGAEEMLRMLATPAMITAR